MKLTPLFFLIFGHGLAIEECGYVKSRYNTDCCGRDETTPFTVHTNRFVTANILYNDDGSMKERFMGLLEYVIKVAGNTLERMILYYISTPCDVYGCTPEGFGWTVDKWMTMPQKSGGVNAVASALTPVQFTRFT